MDLIVKLPGSYGFDAILVVVDHLTKMAHFIPTVESLSAQELSRRFITHFLRIYGIPCSIVSDWGPQFISTFWSSLLAQLQVEVKLSSACHPQSDGQTERTNQALETYLQAYCSYQ